MRLVVRKYVENGALSGPKSVRFEYNYNNSIYIIQIEQCRIRKIIIEPAWRTGWSYMERCEFP